MSIKTKGHLVQTDDPKDDIAIRVQGVSKSFKLPHNRQSSLKGAIINLVGRGDRTYETQEVLKDVSFEIKKGEFFGIVGRNGSGKSTLLKMLAGIYTPTAGKIIVNGSLTPFIELGVGFNPELTGRENVFLNGALLGFNEKEMSTMYDEIVSFAELERFMDQKLKNYSSGMQVRLAFSIAIQAKSDILLLDEVLAVGDAAFQQKCYDYFEKLKRNKQTVIIVTHDMGAVRRFCTRAMFISQGVIKEIGTPEDIADRYTESNIQVDTTSTKHDDSEGLEIECEFPAKIQFEGTEDISLKVRCEGLDVDSFINISFVHNGAVFADRNSRDTTKNLLKDNQWAVFTQPLNGFNPGKYDVHLSIHRWRDNGLISHTPRAFSFIVKGKDTLRDGPMKIEGTWKGTKEEL